MAGAAPAAPASGCYEAYEVLRTVGVGTHGVARLVRARGGERRLWVLKEVALSPRSQEAARREAELLARLRHPHVLSLRESFVDEKRCALCIVTEYCAGGDLFTAIERAREAGERFAEADIVRWTAQIASALSYLHANKILHRDLKTQNVFLTKDGEVRVGDLGLSKVLEHTSDLATTVAGTPFYLAPEICQNRPYSTASDVWSLGCVVYELATLKHAFDGASLLSLVYSILQGDYERVGAPYSPELSALVDVCLQADPAARPSIRAVLEVPCVAEEVTGLIERQKQRGALRRQASLDRETVAETRHPGELGRVHDGVLSPAAADRASAHASQPDETQMTPRERMLARKRAAADARTAELRGAAVGIVETRRGARARFEAQFNSTAVVVEDARGARGPTEQQQATAERRGIADGEKACEERTGSARVANDGAAFTYADAQAYARAHAHEAFTSTSAPGEGLSIASVSAHARAAAAGSVAAAFAERTVACDMVLSNDFSLLRTSAEETTDKVCKEESQVPRPHRDPPHSDSVADEVGDGDGYYSDSFEEYDSEDERTDLVALRSSLGDSALIADAVDAGAKHAHALEDTAPAQGRRHRCVELRERCLRLLGPEAFEAAYDLLSRKHTGDPTVREELTRLVGHESFSLCFMVDQLIFLEGLHHQGTPQAMAR